MEDCLFGQSSFFAHRAECCMVKGRLKGKEFYIFCYAANILIRRMEWPCINWLTL